MQYIEKKILFDACLLTDLNYSPDQLIILSNLFELYSWLNGPVWSLLPQIFTSLANSCLWLRQENWISLCLLSNFLSALPYQPNGGNALLMNRINNFVEKSV